MRERDEKYAAFTAPLIPNIDKNTIIGVRSPALRKIAKELKNDENIAAFLKELPHKYYEENQLHASFICRISQDIDVVFDYIDEFLPYVDNWAVCDGLVAGLKIFKKYPEKVYAKVKEYLKSDDDYTVRFGVVTLLAYYLDENFDASIIDTLINIKTDEYYINMALAWYYSFGLIKQYDIFVGIFERKILPRFVHNKSIQKAIESYRISGDRKDYLRSLKI
jgi:3-methyladenine DNA glycosylase AlkD